MSGDGRSVLVVDDDRVNRIMLFKLLEDSGYRPRAAVDGREALEVLAEEPFDAVLLDIVMPELDGLEVLRRVKSNSHLWHIPVIMVSAVEETDSIVACLELGAEDYLLKPFDPVILRARLNGCLARKRFHSLETEYQRMVNQQAAELEELRGERSQWVAERPTEEQRFGELRRFLPAAVAERVASPENQAALAPHRRPVVVVSVALSGFSAHSLKVDPHEALEVLEGFSVAVGAVAARFGATVSSLAGTTATLVLNDPLPSPDSVGDAVRMADALGRELAAALMASWWERHGHDLHWRAGIATGEATCGVVSGDDRRDYVVVGPVVDRAAAVREAMGAEKGIVLDEEAWAAVRNLVDVEPLASARPGGPAAAYRVILPLRSDVAPDQTSNHGAGAEPGGGPTL